MKVQVQTYRSRGELVSAAALKLKAPLHGFLSVKERKDHRLGRVARVARLIDPKEPGDIDLMPELRDAQLLGVKDNLMTLSGYERVADHDYAQSWKVELD